MKLNNTQSFIFLLVFGCAILFLFFTMKKCISPNDADLEYLKNHEDSIALENKKINEKYPQILDYKKVKGLGLNGLIKQFGIPISKKISNDCTIEGKCMIVKFSNNIEAEFTEHGIDLISLEIHPKESYEFNRDMKNLIGGYDFYKDISESDRPSFSRKFKWFQGIFCSKEEESQNFRLYFYSILIFLNFIAYSKNLLTFVVSNTTNQHSADFYEL